MLPDGGKRTTDLAITPKLVRIVPRDADTHHRYRLSRFAEWLGETGRDWTNPDLVLP